MAAVSLADGVVLKARTGKFAIGMARRVFWEPELELELMREAWRGMLGSRTSSIGRGRRLERWRNARAAGAG
jgi:hypothetical protein